MLNQHKAAIPRLLGGSELPAKVVVVGLGAFGNTVVYEFRKRSGWSFAQAQIGLVDEVVETTTDCAKPCVQGGSSIAPLIYVNESHTTPPHRRYVDMPIGRQVLYKDWATWTQKGGKSSTTFGNANANANGSGILPFTLSAAQADGLDFGPFAATNFTSRVLVNRQTCQSIDAPTPKATKQANSVLADQDCCTSGGSRNCAYGLIGNIELAKSEVTYEPMLAGFGTAVVSLSYVHARVVERQSTCAARWGGQ